MTATPGYTYEKIKPAVQDRTAQEAAAKIFPCYAAAADKTPFIDRAIVMVRLTASPTHDLHEIR